MPNDCGSSPDASMFGSITGVGFATKPTLGGRMFIASTSGAMLRARNAIATSFRIDGADPAFKTPRHCKKRARGLGTLPRCGSEWTACHALQVSFGVSVLPLRVSITTFPFARHQIFPHAAVDFASSTEDSYMPWDNVSGPILNSQP